MPTGYTAAIAEGKSQTFEQFVLSCARAFGALIEMRDSPMDATIPQEFKPSVYHQDKLREARAALVCVEAMMLKQAAQEEAAEYARGVDRANKQKIDRAAVNARYQAMLDRVLEWKPPTVDHVGLHDFMIEQLRISFDSYEIEMPKRALTAAIYRADRIARARRDVEYHEQGWADEQKRAADRSAWVRNLRDSLRAAPPKAATPNTREGE